MENNKINFYKSYTMENSLSYRFIGGGFVSVKCFSMLLAACNISTIKKNENFGEPKIFGESKIAVIIQKFEQFSFTIE